MSVIRHLSLSVFSVILGVGLSAQRHIITPQLYLTQVSIIEDISETQSPSRGYEVESIPKPQFRISIQRKTKGVLSYGASLSLLSQSKFVSFDFYSPNAIQSVYRNAYTNRVEHKSVGIEVCVSRDFGNWRLGLGLGTKNNFNFKSRVAYTGIFEYYAESNILIGSDGEAEYKIGAFGLQIPKYRNSFYKLFATLSVDYAINERFHLSTLIHYQRFPSTMLSFRTYEVSQWTEYPEDGGIILDERNRSGQVNIHQDNLNLSIGLSYDIPL